LGNKGCQSRIAVMHLSLRRAIFLLLVSALLACALPAGFGASAQDRSAHERIVRDIETRGFSDISGLRRRGGNYIFQAKDLLGNKVRVVMNAETGEIVGLSRVMPDKK
jgi:hypothetical protein